MMSMTARRSVPCSTRSMVPSPRSPPMAHTTRTASTARSLPVIPKPRSSCHRVRVRFRARPPILRPLRVTGICKRLPNMAAWVGRKPRGTTGGPWWKPISAAGNGSSVMRCAHKPTSVKQPKWHSLSTSSTACWRWDARATSASYETTRAWDHCVHRLIQDTGRIVAAALTTNDVDDGSHVGPLLDQIDSPIASFTADGAYDQDGVYSAVAARHPEAAVIVPPRSNAVPSETADTTPTPRDRHLQAIAEHGRMSWQKASGYNWRALVEADIGRWKRVIGHALRSQTDKRQATEVALAVNVLNRMLALGRPSYVRIV